MDTGFFTIATSIFFVINATGQIPLFLALLSRFDQRKQVRIILRELSVALLILLAFTFFGDNILDLIGITRPILSISGGVLLFLISLTMIFPKAQDDPNKALAQEPMIIPLAMPIIAGPGAMATVMLYSHETGSELLVSAALITAWSVSLVILLLGSYLKELIGARGLVAIEKLGGMLVCLIGVQMLMSGVLLLVKEYFEIGV
jgi:multiple antibiotic resistance protein